MKLHRKNFLKQPIVTSDCNLIFRLRPYHTVSSPMIWPYAVPYHTVGYADTARKPYSIRPYSIRTADCAEESRNYRRINQSQRQGKSVTTNYKSWTYWCNAMKVLHGPNLPAHNLCISQLSKD